MIIQKESGMIIWVKVMWIMQFRKGELLSNGGGQSVLVIMSSKDGMITITII